MDCEPDQYLDDYDRVLPGLICDRCKYDLRGQLADDACPECGEKIRPMLDALALADRRRPLLPLVAFIFVFASPVFPLFFYLLALIPWTRQKSGPDWYLILISCAIATIMPAGVLVFIAAITEKQGETNLRRWLVAASIGLTMLGVFYFAIVIVIALELL